MIEKLHLLGNIFMYVKMKTKDNKEYFKKEKNKEKYIELLKENYKKCNVRIIAYCVMTNSVYLIIYSEDSKNIYTFLSNVEKSFKKYCKQSDGSIFNKKVYYKSLVNPKEKLRYIALIHNIPIYGRLAKTELEYSYTSYKEYVEQKEMINTEIANLIFNTPNMGIKKFLKMEYNDLKQLDETDDLRKVVNNYLKIRNITEETLKANIGEQKRLLCYMISLNCIFSKQALAEFLGIKRSTFYRNIERRKIVKEI